MPGIGEFQPRALAAALEAFGPNRLLWGSDFPVVGSREGYRNALDWPRALIRDLNTAAVAPMFGESARAVFALS